MSLKKIALFSAVACIGFLSVANANYTFYNRYVGQYLSVGAGVSYADKIYVNGAKESGFRGFGTGLFLGDLITRYWGPEIGFQYFDLPQMGGLILLNLTGRFTQSFGQSVSLFEKLGIGLDELRTCYQGCFTSDNMSPTFGLGIGVGLTEQWMTSLEFNGAYLTTNSQNGAGVIGGFTLGATRYFNT
ncbi:MAG: hypothetical protein A3F13_09365 [Gammaproteobacteria bacterium RIFCSPHIGHO2_12_FULL_40_19]|nr:MAG: hypothetical protein A3F13_09365 [Gammaproteobacteria bacterium RIFCSPHIGHO2_12_FULL_40_19]